MKTGFRIGRIFGIAISVDWSWLLIFVLITWNLSVVFGSSHPDWSMGLSWGVAFTAALLFFASVLAHEMAHSLVAKANGTPVRGITLFLFGGVSNIEREPPSPGVEFVMAVVGPLTSIVLGGLLILAGGLTSQPVGDVISQPQELVARLDPLTTLLMWLGSVNIILGFFNLIPGFPLDGGRVVRSIIWAISDDLHLATRWAARIGQGIAWLLIIAGLAMIFGLRVPLFGSGFTSGLWLAFIGWFLHSSAVASYRQVVIQDVLEDIPVERMMRTDPPSVPPGISVEELVNDGILRQDDHAFPVVDEGRLVGLVTLEDVRKIPRNSWQSTVVREIMTPADQLAAVAPQEEAAEAMTRLMERDVRQLPVLQNGTLVGLLRRRDIVRWLQLHSELELG